MSYATSRMTRRAFLLAPLLLAGCLSPLHHAAGDGNVPEIKRLLASGVNPNIVNENLDKWTPLASAAANGQLAAIRALLEGGADPLFRCAASGTARQIALYHGNTDAAEILRKAEAAKIGSASYEPAAEAPRGVMAEASLSAATPESAPAAASPSAPSIISDVDRATEKAAERPDDFALVIGVEEYQSLPKADYGVRDARTVRRHLAALGIPERNIISLEGSGATKSKLASYLQEWLPLNVKPDSTLFVYYSGHGAPDARTGDAYLVPWDGDPKFLKSTAYPLKQFYSDLAKVKAKRIVVALDACFSGAGGRSVLARGARPLVVKVDDGVSAAAGNLTVLAAASGDEITGTLDEQGHGLFTYYFLKGLSGAAKGANGTVTPRSLYDYLKPRVEDEARRQNREQSPTFAGSRADEPLARY